MDTASATACQAWALRLCLGFTFLVISTVAAIAGGGPLRVMSNLPPCPPWEPRMDPTHESFRGQDVVWQIPPHPKAVLFFAHGATQDPFGFFDNRPSCKQCYGLPEQRKAVLDALDRGYAVIALKSIGNWWVTLPVDTSPDIAMATSLIGSWTKAHSLDHLPVMAWGHSAGGWFVSGLSLKVPFRALVIMCSYPRPELLEIISPDQFPPMFFAHMARDLKNQARVAKWMSILSAGGVAVAEKRFNWKQLTPHFFAQRFVCLDNGTSETVYNAYKAEGWLDNSGYVNRDPSFNDWKFPLRKWEVLVDHCSDLGTSCLWPHVGEELSIAYGKHCFASDENDAIFSWLETRLSEKSAVVAEISVDHQHSFSPWI